MAPFKGVLLCFHRGQEIRVATALRLSIDCLHGERGNDDNRGCSFLPRAEGRTSTPVRGPTGVLRRATSFRGSGPPIRVSTRFLPDPVLPLPARNGPRVLSSRSPRRKATPARGQAAG